MKYVLLFLLACALAACNPFPETEEEADRRLRKNATPTPLPTPKPTPKPGAWMNEKRNNPLEQKAYK